MFIQRKTSLNSFQNDWRKWYWEWKSSSSDEQWIRRSSSFKSSSSASSQFVRSIDRSIQSVRKFLSHLEMILETSPNSTMEQQIHHVLQKHFLEQRPITWKPIKVEFIVNTVLTDDFFGQSGEDERWSMKRNAFLLAIRKRFEKAAAGNRAEFEEHYGFLVENDPQIVDIAMNGYQTVETSFNVLGKDSDRCRCLKPSLDCSMTLTKEKRRMKTNSIDHLFLHLCSSACFLASLPLHTHTHTQSKTHLSTSLRSLSMI